METAEEAMIGRNVIEHLLFGLRLDYYPGDIVQVVPRPNDDIAPLQHQPKGMINCFVRLKHEMSTFCVQDDVTVHKGSLTDLLLRNEPFRFVDEDQLVLIEHGEYRQYLASLTPGRSLFGEDWRMELDYLISVGMARPMSLLNPNPDTGQPNLGLLRDALSRYQVHAYDEHFAPYWIEPFEAAHRIAQDALLDLRHHIEDRKAGFTPA